MWTERIAHDGYIYTLAELMIIKRWLIIKYSGSFYSDDEIWDMAHIDNMIFDCNKRDLSCQ